MKMHDGIIRIDFDGSKLVSIVQKKMLECFWLMLFRLKTNCWKSSIAELNRERRVWWIDVCRALKDFDKPRRSIARADGGCERFFAFSQYSIASSI